jgi:hypothetical protein
MRGHWLSGLVLAACVALSGCLLPPPDLPPIGPPSVQTPPNGTAQPVTAPNATAPNAGADAGKAAPTLAPQPSPSASAVPGTLAGTVTGASAIAFTPEAGGPTVGPLKIGADGAFSAALPPGVYRLTLTVDGAAYTLGATYALAAGETRRLTISVSGKPPVASVSEQMPLATPSPSPQ